MSRRLKSRRSALLLVLMPLAAAPWLAAAPQTGTTTNVRARMERAIALLAAEEVDRAIPILLSVVEEVPHHGPARFQLGALAVEREEWEVAADHLRAAVASTGPAAPEGVVPAQRPGLAWALYSEALARAGRLEEALAATGHALRFAPNYLPALLGRSDLARRLAAREAGDDASPSESVQRYLETGLEAARQARTLAPEGPGPWTALALAAHAAGASELARCAAERAASTAPDDPRALFLVARTTSEADPGAALVAAEAALDAGLSEEPALWMTLGRLRAFRMDMDGSVAAYRAALRLDPAAAGEVASLALDAIAASEDAELLVLLADRAARRPDALNTRFALAKAALRKGQLARALPELGRLAELAPDHAAILTSLHAALRRSGDLAEADAVLGRLEAVKAADAEAWERANRIETERQRARAAAAAGDWDEAVRRWEAILLPRGDPDAPASAADLAGFSAALERLGRHPEALAVLRRSLALRPFESETLSAAARVAHALGDRETAERHAVRARLSASDCR